MTTEITGAEFDAMVAAEKRAWPCQGFIGTSFPATIITLHIDCDPLPLSAVAIERITFLLEHGIALRLLATDQRWIDRFCSAVEALGDQPPGAKAN